MRLPAKNVHADIVEANAAHAELRADPALWNALPFVGYQLYGEAREQDALVVELRHCPCGSTLGRRISRADLLDRQRALDEALAHIPVE